MKYALKERVKKPELFIERKEDLEVFLKWIDDIKLERSQSLALLAHQKMVRTAFMERLFNITFARNDQVIPFYYEIKEEKKWMMDFCIDFFMTFIYQYIAFKTRKTEYLNPWDKSDFQKAIAVAESEGLEYLTNFIEGVSNAAANECLDLLWLTVKDAPRYIAVRKTEFIVQMIDEFHLLNSTVYRDKEMTNPEDTLAGGYLSTAESKVAPLLVAGSWSYRGIPLLENVSENEVVETVFNPGLVKKGGSDSI